MVSSMVSATRHKKMNESSVSLHDEIVSNVTARIHKEAKEYYEAPMKLLEGFEDLEGLLSGVSVFQCVCLSVCMCVELVFVSFCLSVCVSGCLPVCLFVCLFVCVCHAAHCNAILYI